ncbi:balbiani ring protein 3 isoform X2 [Bactrocera dorsalis]|uniref:Balbiani ring protein 3 isoform X2 n=1 Tax=Bactrocera dorsalis TaxID=27457 RepID=A0A6I9UZN9_BACDO|nr:balbiani ring protein 3 isoform X2 [Bactrocera dorsalis]
MYMKHGCTSTPLLLWLTVITFSVLYNNIACIEIPTRFLYKRSADADNTPAAADAGERARTDGTSDENMLTFYKELANVTDVEDLIERFVDKDSIDPQLGLQDTFRRSVERANVVQAKSAACMPESTVVPLIPLESSNDPKIDYFPKCTRVKRCGGCCGSQLMSCQPAETETINFEVIPFEVVGGRKMRLRGKDIVVVEQHTKCKCDCRIKAKDCKQYQTYRPDKCSCECTNEDDELQCSKQGHKYWDQTECRCVCRDSQSCTTGTIFDDSQCACIEITTTDDGSNAKSATSNSPTLLDRRRFIVKAIPVEVKPDDSTRYSV